MINRYYNKSSVEYEGKISIGTTYYNSKIQQTSVFSDRFKALWTHIIENVGENKSIKNIKEYSFSKFNDDNYNRDVGIYMVYQKEQFLISEKFKIYAYTYINSEINESDDSDNKKSKRPSSKIEKIVIELFSYHSDVQTIKNYVETLTNNYLSSVEQVRENKRFIYTLINNKWEENSFEMWNETHFTSTRTFQNFFFSGKQHILNKLDFFFKNVEWYYEKGIPYSIGIGLRGPPGTGKTSFIKALANYTNRHIINISFKLIKTKKQLDSIFFEERYNSDNKKGSITFDKKIIVFEDIDCIGDIVLSRDKKKVQSVTGLGQKLNYNELTTNSQINIGDLLETIAITTEKENDKTCKFPKLVSNDEPITLDDILNLWDGIRETPGRILVISSNHYFDLDPALIRPGRIDITLELSYATRETISEIYFHFFKQNINPSDLENINDKFYSPAEIVNIYMNENMDPERFVSRLARNIHI